VLIINLWTTDIGRYRASNYGLLQVIFEVNLRLFGQTSKKKLLFIFRDFDERTNNFKVLREMIYKDMRSIWNNIFKPDQYLNSEPEDFFSFEFETLPHKNFEEKKFKYDCCKLKSRFELNNAHSFFMKHMTNKIPIDGLPLFIEKTWEKIRSSKELNLPDQRVMIANLRCGEIKDEAFASVGSRLSKIKEAAELGVIKDFKTQCQEIVETSLKYYDNQAIPYEQKVF